MYWFLFVHTLEKGAKIPWNNKKDVDKGDFLQITNPSRPEFVAIQKGSLITIQKPTTFDLPTQNDF